MKTILHKRFEKQYAKLRPADKEKFKARRDIFLDNPFDPVLSNHALIGKYEGYRTISITGDLRAVYTFIDRDTVLFVAIGTHSQLYK
ncbi:type II toxin-antitoxin system mRNA interferase toxin, RelE/StbE family [Pedobacter sp.]|jgi:addiction module RelE/StbE family toxin|uniref:type II toxin-antitoxin system RelE/ParE family toxin n=1 Tax=Pedobacter sp. TaxID=1411316 RepID=UPI002C8B60CA|nr:type II toxin-antitoxin system mRNA interferase toxin, RelE/StbE family [Pedobacter sp.]HWW38687.1 type II toxin-antitoxin system mRNA interferase toxin, RelE/StbE family [Pedobacter sp.]